MGRAVGATTVQRPLTPIVVVGQGGGRGRGSVWFGRMGWLRCEGKEVGMSIRPGVGVGVGAAKKATWRRNQGVMVDES